jgi:hypothetical protein
MYFNCTSLCRASDAAAFAYDAGFNVQVGYIARTLYPGFGSRGSLEINESNPRFEITASEERGFNTDDHVNMIGSTSGWTQGTITQTCVTQFNVAGFGHDLACLTATNLHSEGGDSGAPIFLILGGSYPSHVLIRGIVWGGATNDTWYSTMTGIAEDFYSGTPWPPNRINPCSGVGGRCADPPLQVWIDGPYAVRPSDLCTWNAGVQGGEAPFSYQWSGVLSGTSESVFGHVWSSGYLDLHVTSADTQTADYEMYVNSDWGNGEACPY